MPLVPGINLKEIASKTEGFSGADLKALCTEAAMIALRHDMNANKIEKRHFAGALSKIKPTPDPKDAKKYKKALEDVKSEEPRYVG